MPCLGEFLSRSRHFDELQWHLNVNCFLKFGSEGLISIGSVDVTLSKLERSCTNTSMKRWLNKLT